MGFVFWRIQMVGSKICPAPGINVIQRNTFIFLYSVKWKYGRLNVRNIKYRNT